MIRNTLISMTMVWALAFAASGCGDASAAVGSKCAQMCQHWEDCPGLTWAVDCVSICEELVEDAEVLGGTCPGLLEAELDCMTQLSCGEVYLRNTGGFYTDECVAKEAARMQCEPGDPVPAEDVNEEFSLACEAFCNAADDCPTLEADADCREECVATMSGFENGTELCTESLLNDITCQAALTCSALSNRVNGRFVRDACTEADSVAEAACF